MFLAVYPRFLQHARRSHIGWDVAARVRCAKSRERVERCRIDVVRITFVEFRHRVSIPEVALYFASFSVKYLNSIEICLFAICLCFGASRGRIRVARLAEAVTLMKRVFTEDEVSFEGTYYRTVTSECRPKTVQQPRPPILIAAGGPQILELAGREAEIVAVIPPGAGVRAPAADDVAVAGVQRQLEIARRGAGSRFDAIELSCFVDVTLTDDRDRTIAELAGKAKIDPAVLESSVYRGIGTLDQVREHIARVRRETGITYFCLRGPHVEELAPVVRNLAGT